MEFFEAKIRPVLAEHCYQCHSVKSEKIKAGLLMDSRAGLLKGGESGPAVVPGKPDDSLLIKAVRHDQALDLSMPPKKPKLPDATIADLTTWVKAGAPWPKEAAPVAAASTAGATNQANVEKVRKGHWAFQPLSKPAPPSVKDAGWVKTPVDAFILAKIEAKGLKPNPPADRRTLLRRVYLDLIGLPPTPGEQEKFLADGSPDAFEKVVDDLLARPQYGERWGRHWLDVARYAETQGYERDEPKAFAWRYRDYVIKSFNDDKPYDRFVTEQLAGDEVENPNAETQAAVSFLAVGTFDTIAADAKQARYDQMDDVVGTTTAAFLGQSVRCARCHDHKFEPYPQADYYKLLSVFEPLQGRRGPHVDRRRRGEGGLQGVHREVRRGSRAAAEGTGRAGTVDLRPRGGEGRGRAEGRQGRQAQGRPAVAGTAGGFAEARGRPLGEGAGASGEGPQAGGRSRPPECRREAEAGPGAADEEACGDQHPPAARAAGVRLHREGDDRPVRPRLRPRRPEQARLRSPARHPGAIVRK